MRYSLLGTSGLRVSELCLGTMTFGTDWGFGAGEDEARRQVEVFAEAGGNFIDTANNYTDGTAERLLGSFLKQERDRWVLATKYSLNTDSTDPNAGGNQRKNLVRSLDASLRRLDTDYVDILWLHAWDGVTPMEEIMRAFDDQVSAGKVLYLGISDTPAWVIAQGQTLALLRGFSPFIGVQVPYSLAQREAERELVPMARAMGLGVAAWSPLAGGLLSGKYRRDQGSDEPRRLGEQSPEHLRLADLVGKVADELGASSGQVALSWLRAQGGVVPILGARTSAQLQENLGCTDLALSRDHLDRLDQASRIPLGFPHDFLDEMTDLIFGPGMRQRIDVSTNHDRNPTR